MNGKSVVHIIQIKIFKVKNKDDSKKIIELCDNYGKNYHITPQFNITYNKNKTMFNFSL